MSYKGWIQIKIFAKPKELFQSHEIFVRVRVEQRLQRWATPVQQPLGFVRNDTWSDIQERPAVLAVGLVRRRGRPAQSHCYKNE